MKRLNEEARAKKEARRKAFALQPHLAELPVAAEIAAPATAPVVLSKNAQKRRDQKNRRRQAAQRRETERQEAADEEFVRVTKQVEWLKLREPEDLTCDAQPERLEKLDSVKALGAKLGGLEKQQRQDTARAKSRPARAGDVEQAMLESNTLGGQMRQDVVKSWAPSRVWRQTPMPLPSASLNC